MLVVALCILTLAPAVGFADAYDALIKQGQDHYNLFQYKEARVQFEKAVAADAGRFEGHYQLGLTLRKLNDLAGSQQALEKAFGVNAQNTECQQALASIYVSHAKAAKDKGDRERMLEWLEKACLTYPLNTGNWANLYGFYLEAGQNAKITRTAEGMLAANRDGLAAGDDKQLQKALTVAAQAYYREKNVAKARTFLRQAANIRNENPDGVALGREIDTEAKSMVEGLIAEAEALAAQKKYKQAIDKLTQAQSADPGRTEISNQIDQMQKDQSFHDHLDAADASEAKKDWHDALQHLEASLSFTEDQDAIKGRIASITTHIEKIEKAQAAANRAALDAKFARQERAQQINILRTSAKQNEDKKLYKAALLNVEQLIKMLPADGTLVEWQNRLRKQIVDEEQRQKELGAAIDKGMGQYNQGQFDDAFQTFKPMLEGNNRVPPEIWPAMIDSCFATDRLADAKNYLEMMQKAAAAPPAGTGSGSGSKKPPPPPPSADDASPLVNYFAGKIAYLEGDTDKAATLLYKAYKADALLRPDLSGMIWRMRAQKYMILLIIVALLIGWKASQIGLAFLRRFNKARLDGQIEAALSKNDPARAAALIQKRLADDEYIANRRQLTYSLADAQLKLGQFAEATATAQQAMAKDPKNVTGIRILGEAAFRGQDSSPDGLSRMQALLKLDESRRDVLGFMATAYRSNNDDSRTAIDTLSMQIRLNPKDQDTLFYLAELLARRESFNEANLKIFERAMRADPENANFCFAYGRSLQQSGKRDEGLRVLQEGAQRWPAEPCFQSYGAPAADPYASAPGEDPGYSAAEMADYAAAAMGNPSGGDAAPASFAGAGGADDGGGVMLPDLDNLAKPPPPAAPPPPPPGGGIACPHCSAANHPREYYCTTCGKPLK